MTASKLSASLAGQQYELAFPELNTTCKFYETLKLNSKDVNPHMIDTIFKVAMSALENPQNLDAPIGGNSCQVPSIISVYLRRLPTLQNGWTDFENLLKSCRLSLNPFLCEPEKPKGKILEMFTKKLTEENKGKGKQLEKVELQLSSQWRRSVEQRVSKGKSGETFNGDEFNLELPKWALYFILLAFVNSCYQTIVLEAQAGQKICKWAQNNQKFKQLFEDDIVPKIDKVIDACLTAAKQWVHHLNASLLDRMVEQLNVPDKGSLEKLLATHFSLGHRKDFPCYALNRIPFQFALMHQIPILLKVRKLDKDDSSTTNFLYEKFFGVMEDGNYGVAQVISNEKNQITYNPPIGGHVVVIEAYATFSEEELKEGSVITNLVNKIGLLRLIEVQTAYHDQFTCSKKLVEQKYGQASVNLSQLLDLDPNLASITEYRDYCKIVEEHGFTRNFQVDDTEKEGESSVKQFVLEHVLPYKVAG